MAMTVGTKHSNARKSLIWNGVAAAMWMGATLGLVHLVRSDALGDPGRSELIAAFLGLVYLFLAAQVGVALASVALRTGMLSAEDVDDLRRQRRPFAYAVATMVATGAGLIVVALAEPSGIVPPTVALGIALVLATIAALAGFAQWRHLDELMRGLSRETGNISYYLVLAVGGGWALFAHLGFASGPQPLDWLTMLLGLVLVASFIATGRRGLLRPH